MLRAPVVAAVRCVDFSLSLLLLVFGCAAAAWIIIPLWVEMTFLRNELVPVVNVTAFKRKTDRQRTLCKWAARCQACTRALSDSFVGFAAACRRVASVCKYSLSASLEHGGFKGGWGASRPSLVLAMRGRRWVERRCSGSLCVCVWEREKKLKKQKGKDRQLCVCVRACVCALHAHAMSKHAMMLIEGQIHG